MRALRPEDKAYLFKIRKILDKYYPFIVEDLEAINDSVEGMRLWGEGSYKVGDVVQLDDIPYKCIQAHDSTGNASWAPDLAPALWMQYHGTTKENARKWVAPLGSEDIYKAGEWMIFTDGNYYKCLTNTNYSPTELASAWALNGEETASSEAIPDFVQPTGTSDAYSIGDKVKFEGKIYQSLINSNVWSPSAYPLGWQEVSE